MPLDPCQTVEKATLIVNPVANNGAALKNWRRLEPSLRAKLPRLKVLQSERRGHCEALTRQALQSGAGLVIAFGGDGTLNEVLNGFLDDKGRNLYPDAVLGVLAAGSGSDFQRMFGRLGLAAQIEQFFEATTKSVDYGVAHYLDENSNKHCRAFLNIASMGLSVEVVHRLEMQQSEGSARARYLKATLRSIFAFQNKPARVRLDGQRASKVDLTLACAANGRFFGSGMEISPKSRVDDGQLRILTASVSTRLRLLNLLRKVYGGQHLGAKAVRYSPAQHAEFEPIDAQRRIRLELDGEYVGLLPARFEIQTRALRIRLPTCDSRASDKPD